MPRTHARSVLLGNIPDVLNVVDQLPCVVVWRSGYRQFMPAMRFGEQAYQGVARACLESTLMSLRCLDEFFIPGGWSDDVRAEDYPGFTKLGGFLSAEKRATINKHIAHFTVPRATNQVLIWSYKQEIIDGTFKAMEFLEYLSREFLSIDDDVLPRVKGLQQTLPFFVLEIGREMMLEVYEK